MESRASRQASQRVSHLGAIGLALAGFTFWVFTDTSIKLAGYSRLPVYEISMSMGIVSVLALILRGVLRGDVRALWPQNLKSHSVRSLLDLGNNLCVVLALRHLTLTLFYILVFLAPMATAVLSSIFLHERLGWRKVLAVALGFTGVIVAVNPYGASRQGDWIGYGACMICVACFSANMVWSRVLTQTETPESLTFSSGLVLTVMGALLLLWHAEPLTLRLTVNLLAVGVFYVLGTMCFFFALKHTSPVHVSQCHYTQLVTGAIVTYLIWREKPTLFMIGGAVLIVAAGLLMAVSMSQSHESSEVFLGPGD
jgi:drug/metabolite transporter (DMT)-like permease